MKLRKLLFMTFLIMTICTSCNQSTSDTGDTNPKQDITIDTEDVIFNDNKQEIEYYVVKKDIPMENRGLLLEVIGSAIYDKIEGKSFTDMPSDGKKYLVLYLSVKNTSGKDEYFNYNNIVTKLDGKDITDTFLVNDPLKYTTIKTYLTNGMITQGYLVWEVPESWEKLEVTYTGLTPTHFTEPTIVITPKDLEEPEEYKEDNRII